MLTVLPAIAGTHSIPLTLKAFRRVQQQFGVFPLPTEATILAAELLCVALTGRNVDLGAVGVVEVQASGLTTFLAAASGAGQIPADAVVEWQAAVREKLINPNSTLHTVSCMALTTEATFYVPAHQTTAAFIKEAFEDFAIPGRPLTYADLKTTINEIKQMPSSPFGVKPDGSVLPAGYKTEMVPVKKLLAIAVAMRIKAFDRQALADARNALDRHATIVSWGPPVLMLKKIVEQYKKENVHLELIDLRTIAPLDIQTIIKSVEKTERLLIVHEAVKTNGVGAEIAAQISEKSIFSIAAPILRVTGYDTPYPVGTIEDDWLPNEKRIVNAIEQLLSY